MKNKVLEILQSGKCFIIAEVAQAHDGSLGIAHAFIDAAAESGADAIKFQTHIAEAESTMQEQWRVKFSLQDVTRFDYWKRMEFTPEQWAGLKQHAEDKGLIFLSSPFSNEAVDLLESINMDAWKIASGELTNYPMLEKILATRKPILISSGMSDLDEVDRLVNQVKSLDIEHVVFQCTSSYPTPPEKVGLNMLDFYRQRYECKVGLSDHSGSIFPPLAAAALGMDVLELHVTFSKHMFGPDVIASLTFEELKTVVEGIRYIETMKASPVEKNDMAATMEPLRKLFNKSVVLAQDLDEGTIIEEKHLGYKKPGIGIPASRYKDILGRKLNKSLTYNYFLSEEDLTDTNEQ